MGTRIHGRFVSLRQKSAKLKKIYIKIGGGVRKTKMAAPNELQTSIVRRLRAPFKYLYSQIESRKLNKFNAN